MFKEMTFKPRHKSRKRVAMWRSIGRAFWIEGTPGKEAKVLIWNKLQTTERERSSWLGCRCCKMRLQKLHF